MAEEEKTQKKELVIKNGFVPMEMKNSELFEMFQALVMLGEYEVPYKIWWTIARNKKVLESAYKEYEENRNAIVEKLGKKNDKNETMAKSVGGMVVPDFGDNTKEAEKMLEDLADEMVSVQVRKISITDLEDIKLKPNIVEPLIGFIIDEE